MPSRVLGRINEHNSVVSAPTLIGGVCDAAEVNDVLGDDRATFLLRDRKDLGVTQRPKLIARNHRVDRVTMVSELIGDGGRIHLVEQKPQPSAFWARSQAVRRRSASCRLSWIHSSISSAKSA